MEADKSGRAIVLHDGVDTIINIPTKKNVFMILFLAAWLGAWFFGFKSVGGELLKGTESNAPSGFLLFWLVGWTAGGCFAVLAILWGAFGKETIISGYDKLSISKNIFGIGFKKEYLKSDIKNIRIDIQTTNSSFLSGSKNSDFWGFPKGVICFDYGMRTVSFGMGIDEPEAKHIIGIITGA